MELLRDEVTLAHAVSSPSQKPDKFESIYSIRTVGFNTKMLGYPKTAERRYGPRLRVKMWQ